MLKLVQTNKTYTYQGRLVTVLRKNTNPWMPSTFTVRLSDGTFDTVMAKSFRRDAV